VIIERAQFDKYSGCAVFYLEGGDIRIIQVEHVHKEDGGNAAFSALILHLHDRLTALEAKS
jgi:hypothetical protein